MTTTTLVTDRDAIAKVIAAGLGELDQLRASRNDAADRVVHAQREADEAEAIYLSKMEEVLATGWATAEGLAAQGHHLPKARRSTKNKKSTPAAETTETGGIGE
jgi:hypothetical protein